MSATTREGQLFDAFATLADTLVAGYDVVELLQTLVETCVNLLDVTAAGILLADQNDELDLVASTSEESHLVETIQLGAEAGPCIDAFTSGEIVSLPDIGDAPDVWQRFRDVALANDFASAFCIPLRLRATTIGTLNLFGDVAGKLSEIDVKAARALADVATIGILHERALRESDSTRAQLQGALNSRVIIEQAKGILASTHGLTMEDAFARLRSFARTNQMPLAEVAQQLVNRSLIF